MPHVVPDLMDALPAGIVHLSRSGRVVHASAGLGRLLGCSAAGLRGRSYAELLHTGERFRVAERLAELRTGGREQVRFGVWLAGGAGPVQVEVRVAPRAGVSGGPGGWVAVAVAVEGGEGVPVPSPDAEALRVRLERLLARARRRPGAGFALAWVELPAPLPDAPEEAGRLCRWIADRLQDAVRPVDLVARLEPGRLAVLLHGLHDEVDAFQVARRLAASVGDTLRRAGWQDPPRPGLGVVFSEPDATAAEMLARARQAAGRALAEGIPVAAADPRRHASAVQHLRVQDDLPGGLSGGQLHLHFQPIVTVDSGEVCGVEALVRWAHPRDGLLMPDRFVPAAERSGLVAAMDEWVLGAACAQLVDWMARRVLPPDTVVSVNLSVQSLGSAELAGRVAAALERTGLPPRNLQLEVTETAVVGNVELASRTLAELRALGARIAVDDFGAGFSSLGYLHRLPVDLIKLDRSLLHARRPGPDGARLLEGVVALANHLELPVTVEGVEQEDEVRRLRALGCTQAQGYAFSPPLPPAELEAFLRGRVRLAG